MKSPVKRKKTIKRCPINVDSLYRKWSRGDKRINWKLISKLLDRWEKGEDIPWRKLSHKFIKPGPRTNRRNQNRRQRQEPRRQQEEPNLLTEFLGEFRLWDDYNELLR